MNTAAGCHTCGNPATREEWSRLQITCERCQTWMCKKCIEEGMPHTHRKAAKKETAGA